MEDRFAALEARVARLSTLEERLARVERRARAVVAAGIVLVAGGLSLLFAGPGETQARPQVVRAPFRVVGNQGQTLLLVSENAGLLVNDRAGQRLLTASSLFGGRGLSVYDANGGEIGLLGDILFDEGNRRGLRITDDDGTAVAALGSVTVGVDHGHGLTILDLEGENPALGLGIDSSDGSVGLDINQAGSPTDEVIRLRRAPDGTAALSLSNADLTEEALLQAGAANGSITLRNNAGTVIFQQP